MENGKKTKITVRVDSGNTCMTIETTLPVVGEAIMDAIEAVADAPDPVFAQYTEAFRELWHGFVEGRAKRKNGEAAS